MEEFDRVFDKYIHMAIACYLIYHLSTSVNEYSFISWAGLGIYTMFAYIYGESYDDRHPVKK